MPEVPKLRRLHIFAISPERHGCEVDFLPANKHESFVQVDSITLGLLSQACPKYPKQFYNIFADPFSKKCGIYCNKRYGCIKYAEPHNGLQ